MRGLRYRKGNGLWECGEVEDGDHKMLRCEKCTKERKIIWKVWGRKKKEGEMVDIE